MRRGFKIVAAIGCAVLLVLATMPWWLGIALKPILRAQQITFERYERVGYGSFKLHQARYSHPSVVVQANEVQSDAPLVWLAKRMRGEEPSITVHQWALRVASNSAPSTGKRTLNGMADLQQLLVRLVPILHHWLPKVEMDTGELRGFTPEITLG